MKKSCALILLFLAGFRSYSQTMFEKGYYIDESGTRVEGLIRNEDWESNPTSFDFRLSEQSERQTLSINSVKEFGITGILKYRKCKVLIDRSSDQVSELNNKRNPVFSEETLFLQLLVEGKANLYGYNNKGLTRFFFSKDSGAIEQLVYKSYLNSQNQININSLFRQQLLEKLYCPEVTFNEIKNIDYRKSELIAYFIAYNKSLNVEAVLYQENKNREYLNITIKPGLQYSSLYIQNDFEYFDHINFEDKTSFRAAIEIESVLPFNNNKFALYVQPAFQQYKSSGTRISDPSIGEGVDANIDFKSLELPAGIRYYFFLNNNSKIYLNFDIIFDFSFNSTVAIYKKDGPRFLYYDVKSNTNFSAGLGYKYKRFLLEFNWQTPQNLIKNVPSWVCEYKTFSISLGYTILKK